MRALRKLTLSMALTLGALSSSLAYASSGTSTGRIVTMLWYEGHTGLLVQTETMSDLGGCGRSDYYILDETHPYFKEMYALILSAHFADQPLSLSIQDCSQGISRIRHVQSAR